MIFNDIDSSNCDSTGLCEASLTVGQSLNSSRDSTHARQDTQRLLQDDADSSSERAFASSQTKGKTDSKTSKLHHRMSNAGSVRSKISSPNSIDQNKTENKQKLGKVLKEKTERKGSMDQDQATGASTTDVHSEAKSRRYQSFNTVLYGLPNFTTSLQS